MQKAVPADATKPRWPELVWFCMVLCLLRAKNGLVVEDLVGDEPGTPEFNPGSGTHFICGFVQVNFSFPVCRMGIMPTSDSWEDESVNACTDLGR